MIVKCLACGEKVESIIRGSNDDWLSYECCPNCGTIFYFINKRLKVGVEQREDQKRELFYQKMKSNLPVDISLRKRLEK